MDGVADEDKHNTVLQPMSLHLDEFVKTTGLVGLADGFEDVLLALALLDGF